MRKKRVVLTGLAILLLLPCLSAQETASTEKKDKASTAVMEESAQVPLKVQVVLTEFDGTQKISSFPYTLNVLGAGPHERNDAHLRYGVRVPIATGSFGPNGQGSQFTYQDVGINIDCHAIRRDDGEYQLDFKIDRSSVTVPGSSGKDWKPGDTNPSSQPLIRSFLDEFTVVVKNGQTIEGTSAVDPITGHIQKVEVTLAVLK